MKILYFWLGLSAATPAFAGTIATCGKTHTLHEITTNRSATCVLAKLFEPEHFCLVGADGTEITGASIRVEPGKTAMFAMGFDGEADFNMEFALTCTLNDGAIVKSPKVIFNVGASGPANPDIVVVTLYGARGDWAAAAHGENFLLRF